MENKKSILIIEDDPDMRITIARMLNRNGFKAIEAGTGKTALKMFKNAHADLILLDITLPDTDGISLAREIRSLSEIPIIFVTGKNEVIDRVVGLEIGADDYLTKPFHMRELIARVNTVLRRSFAAPKNIEEPNFDADNLYFDGWKVNAPTRQFFAPSGEEIQMTAYEYRILTTFITHPNKPLTRNQIAYFMGFNDKSSEGRSIDMLVGKVRRKLAAHSGDTQYIKTIRNQGYMFAHHPAKKRAQG